MDRVHTHYDNLKVSREAPPEVIRAAYKSLAQKYHPDRNPGDQASARAMAFINAAYQVLSDPALKADHDAWIVEQERPFANVHREESQQPHQPGPVQPSATTAGPAKDEDATPNRTSTTNYDREIVTVCVIGLLFLAGYLLQKERPTDFATAAPSDIVAAPAVAKRPEQAIEARIYRPSKASEPIESLKFMPPMLAPNGSPWPRAAAYVVDYPRLKSEGLSSVTVDNSRNGSPVFGKLFALDGLSNTAVRYFYIPGFQTFTLDTVTAGRYDVRYQNLDDGGFSKTESFNLYEREVYNGTEYSNLTLTLFKVANGNMRTTRISASEF
ncbi:J domain-containing protein [Pigmentiphaga litoralis]|uniref:J domain-containing protein n=1 Tax=Pigmentiphaga litoralis TaxID=516702 RepID=A0A7Y9LLL0_9BURK|nr:hypothetical protein [Pigmentiphaga litoralis]NYE82682.1 hypothetical protein [Pigmentiphaga litoralis]